MEYILGYQDKYILGIYIRINILGIYMYQYIRIYTRNIYQDIRINILGIFIRVNILRRYIRILGYILYIFSLY